MNTPLVEQRLISMYIHVSDHQLLHESVSGEGRTGGKAQGVCLQHILLPQGHGSRSRVSPEVDETSGHLLQGLHPDPGPSRHALVSRCEYLGSISRCTKLSISSLHWCLAVSISFHLKIHLDMQWCLTVSISFYLKIWRYLYERVFSTILDESYLTYLLSNEMFCRSWQILCVCS